MKLVPNNYISQFFFTTANGWWYLEEEREEVVQPWAGHQAFCES